MNHWVDVCALEDIQPLGARVLERGEHVAVAIFRDAQDQVFALLDQCPHKGGPLSQGIIFGQTVVCPLHSWQIALDSGCAHAPDEGCAQRFAVKQEGGRVFLDGAELASLALAPKMKVVPGNHQLRFTSYVSS